MAVGTRTAGRVHTRVTHTYDWSSLSDPNRLQRARLTTADNLAASLARLAWLVEGPDATDQRA
jgi:hypothetical protein